MATELQNLIAEFEADKLTKVPGGGFGPGQFYAEDLNALLAASGAKPLASNSDASSTRYGTDLITMLLYQNLILAERITKLEQKPCAK